MNLLKRLFGGRSSFGTGSDPALYVYVQPRGCDEVVRVRINVINELSPNEDFSGFFIQKTVTGTTCFQRAELLLTFDRDKRLIEQQVLDGTLVDAAAYAAWQESRSGST